MPFIAIKGTFHVVGYQPDGDSIRFQADTPELWQRLDGPPVRLNSRGHAQLRIEAVDTLETHYQGTHQPAALAEQATGLLLDYLGIGNVVWNGSTVVSADDAVPGFVLSRASERNRRPVSFVFKGEAGFQNGDSVFLDPDHLRLSLNYQSALAGMAYPTYYKGLFPDLRQTLTEAVQDSRSACRGVWAEDATTAGFTVTGYRQVQDELVILPKLFRRLVGFMDGADAIDGFGAYLEASDDPVLELSSGHLTNLDTFVEITGNTIRLTREIHDLVFMS